MPEPLIFRRRSMGAGRCPFSDDLCRVPRGAFSKTRTWQGCGTESHRRKERHNGLSIDRNEKKEYNPGGISRKKARKNEMAKAPLADRLRPKNLSEMVGQEHLFGKNGVIRRVLSKNHLTNMIFYGPPGTGKTTLATIISTKPKATARKPLRTASRLSSSV